MHVVSYRGYVLTSSPNAARARTARVGGSGAPGALSLARALSSRGGRVVRRTRIRSIAARGAEALLETLALHLLGAELLLGFRRVQLLRVLVPVDGARTRAGG